VGTTPKAGMSPIGVGEVRLSETDGKAVATLVLGILSTTILWVFAGIPAIVLGHMSRKAIRRSMGRLKGEGLALAGLVMGYVSVAISAAVIILFTKAAIATPSLVRGRTPAQANEASAVANLRTINTAEVTYLSLSGGKYGTISDLITASLIDSRFTGGGPVSGYFFEVTVADNDSEFMATAIPTPSNIGRYAYYSTADAVVRYSSNLAPMGKAGSPVEY
jgi:hypothetical protein